MFFKELKNNSSIFPLIFFNAVNTVQFSWARNGRVSCQRHGPKFKAYIS